MPKSSNSIAIKSRVATVDTVEGTPPDQATDASAIVADHDIILSRNRRRSRPQPGRHRPRGAPKRPRHGGRDGRATAAATAAPAAPADGPDSPAAATPRDPGNVAASASAQSISSRSQPSNGSSSREASAAAAATAAAAVAAVPAAGEQPEGLPADHESWPRCCSSAAAPYRAARGLPAKTSVGTSVKTYTKPLSPAGRVPSSAGFAAPGPARLGAGAESSRVGPLAMAFVMNSPRVRRPWLPAGA